MANLATGQLDEGGLAGQIWEISDVGGEDEVVLLASHHISGLDLRFGFIARVSSVNKKLHPRLKSADDAFFLFLPARRRSRSCWVRR